LGNFRCPADARERRDVVHAILARGNLPEGRLVYNEELDLYDPDAILFVREGDLEDVRSGARAPEPLVLRAAAGECVKVTLVNDLPAGGFTQAPHWNYSPPIIDGFNTNQVRPSKHVSLHPQLVTYDVRSDDGANVGRNPVQTVAPGERREYSWFAGVFPSPKEVWNMKPRAAEFGSINLRDMSDVVTHGMHGAVGSLIVEPEGAAWTDDPGTHAQSTVRYHDVYGYPRSFRELVVVQQDEIGMRSDDPRFQCRDAGLNCGTAIRNIYAMPWTTRRRAATRPTTTARSRSGGGSASRRRRRRTR
jgi:manganese oxidase